MIDAEYFGLPESEQYSNLSRRFLRDHLPEIRHIRLPGKILIKRSDLDEFLSRFAVEPRAAVDVKGIAERVFARKENLRKARSQRNGSKGGTHEKKTR